MNFKRFHESKNLFDEVYPDISGTIRYRPMFVGDGTFTLSTTTPYDSGVANLFLLSGNVSTGASTTGNGAWLNHNVTVQSDSGYITVAYRQYQGTTSPETCDTMLNTGSTTLPYEPYSSEVWHDIPYYIHNTATDTITTLPAVLYPNDITATVGLKGDMEQSGTPTPTTPIQPQSCGERTAQLYFKKIANASLDGAGNIISNTSFDCYVAQVEANKQYIGTGYVYAFFTGNPSIGSVSYNGQRVVISASNGFTSPIDGYVAVRHNTGVTDAMLNLGSTAKPFEPYGYKIPILLNSTTINKYLGEVQTTRQIKKLVLTGQESWSGTSKFRIGLSEQIGNVKPICTHYRGSNAAAYVDLQDGYITVNGGYNQTLAICDTTNQTSLTAWQTYLQQQYANGTPVTVWYVLATPKTATINEPLMKIGDYADSLTTSIPTTAGANTISIGTTLQPSEVSVNYHGWHPVQSVHERENGAWD